MTWDPGTIRLAATGVAALVFAVTFLVGGRVHPFRALVRDRRNIISFGSGVSAAYVFVHVLPELNGAHRAFVATSSFPLRYDGMGVYFVSLIGFLSFYGLEHARSLLPKTTAGGRAGRGFALHVGGFGAYVWLIGYLLVDNLEETEMSIALYTVAVAFHLLAVDHTLRDEHGATYDRIGRFFLAAMAVFGWGAGVLFALPHNVLALLLAFISGAVIINSLIMELVSEKDGRFLPFLAGGVGYGLFLLPFG